MLKGKWKKLILTMLAVCIIFMSFNNTFAAINEGYYNNYVKNNGRVYTNINSLFSNDLIADHLAKFVYNLACWMEDILGNVFQFVTGTNTFPWADAILFNAIPFLDVNVFNPSTGSFVSTIQEFIAGVYYSVLTLATTFFGIAVMVTAVKLAITAIAEDKATYKKAITSWLLGLVTLWGIHFFMSFVLYLNEQTVAAASGIVSTAMGDGAAIEAAISEINVSDTEIVNSFINQFEKNFVELTRYKARIEKLGEITGYTYIDNPEVNIETAKNTIIDNPEVNIETAKNTIKNNVKLARMILSNSDIMDCITCQDQWYTRETDDGSEFGSGSSSSNFIYGVAMTMEMIENKKTSAAYTNLTEQKESITPKLYLTIRNYINQCAELENVVSSSNTNYNVIANLGAYFKQAALVYTDGAWKAGEYSFSNGVIYAIFVVQSLIFLIAYTKRLFHVIMLIFMAPLVVVVDFFNKFGK